MKSIHIKMPPNGGGERKSSGETTLPRQKENQRYFGYARLKQYVPGSIRKGNKKPTTKKKKKKKIHKKKKKKKKKMKKKKKRTFRLATRFVSES